MQLHSDALESQLDELRNQLVNQGRLQSGSSDVIAVDSFAELPQPLVKARTALRLSQTDLADRLGMKEQQIQRHESTGYQSASMSRRHDVVQALGVSVRLEFKYADGK
jgi:ribosome-binding protein aMBF1 (putative translation factor)